MPWYEKEQSFEIRCFSVVAHLTSAPCPTSEDEAHSWPKKANYRTIESKHTGFHVNLRALIVDEIDVVTTGFGGAGFDFRLYLTCLQTRLGRMSSLSPLCTFPMAQ